MKVKYPKKSNTSIRLMETFASAIVCIAVEKYPGIDERMLLKRATIKKTYNL